MAGYVEVAKVPGAIYAKVVGLGNFNNAGPLREYVEAALNSGTRAVVVDLGQAGDRQPVCVSVVNTTPITLRAMNCLGLPKLVHIKPEPVEPPATNLERLREGWQDRRGRTKLIYEAHKHLVKNDKENEARFAPFLAALVKEAREHLQDLC
jgi:hypothetical protein